MRGGYRLAEQRFDTQNRAPGQPADPVFGITLRGFRPVQKELGNRFSAAIIALIEQACPGALDGGAP
jgi:hypothetical protein